MTELFTFEKAPSPQQLAHLFGDRNREAGFDICYSQRNPASIDDCINLCTGGAWLPIGLHNKGQWVAEHHLADRNPKERWAWSSGYDFEVVRGKGAWRIRAHLWELTRTHFVTLGFKHIFCCVFTHNPWAQRWVEEDCAFTRAAILRSGVIGHDNQRHDIVLYSQRPEDVGLCLETIPRVFSGYGEVERAST